MEGGNMIVNFSQIYSGEKEVNLFEVETQNESYYIKNDISNWDVSDESSSEIHHYNDIEDNELRNALLIRDNDI